MPFLDPLDLFLKYLSDIDIESSCEQESCNDDISEFSFEVSTIESGDLFFPLIPIVSEKCLTEFSEFLHEFHHPPECSSLLREGLSPVIGYEPLILTIDEGEECGKIHIERVIIMMRQ
jgi:hypothetical protein